MIMIMLIALGQEKYLFQCNTYLPVQVVFYIDSLDKKLICVYLEQIHNAYIHLWSLY